MADRKFDRRDFLKVAAAGAAVTAGVRAFQPASAARGTPNEEHQWAMVIDQSKCIGCGYCTLACQAHNDINPDIHWNRVTELPMVADQHVYLPRPCMHCEEAPCVEVCPVQATYYGDGGIVMMDYDRCIGCRYCEVACPYEARSFNWKAFEGENPRVPDWGQPEVARRPRGVVEKCTFCFQRIDRGLQSGLTPGVDLDATPACVVICPVGARIFGDLNDPTSQVIEWLKRHSSYRLREELGTNPRVYYLPAEVQDAEG